MKETQSLAVPTRSGLGKGANRKLRAAGQVPGIYYDAKGANIPVMVDHMPLHKLYSQNGSAHVFDLKIEAETKPSLIWKIERHPTKSTITHVDFYGVDLDKPIRVRIPVEVVGKSKGQVKGGKLEIYREVLEIECLPMAIPDKVVLSITELDVNQHIKVADVELPEGVKAVYDDNFAILAVLLASAEKDAEKEANA